MPEISAERYGQKQLQLEEAVENWYKLREICRAIAVGEILPSQLVVGDAGVQVMPLEAPPLPPPTEEEAAAEAAAALARAAAEADQGDERRDEREPIAIDSKERVLA